MDTILKKVYNDNNISKADKKNQIEIQTRDFLTEYLKIN